MDRETPHQPEDALERLLILQVEGELTQRDQQELAERLHDDPQAQERYARYVALHAWLDWDRADAPAPGIAGDADVEPGRQAVVSPNRRTLAVSGRHLIGRLARPMPLSLLVAFFATPLLFVALLALMGPRWFRSEEIGPDVADAVPFVARLTQTHEPIWADGGESPANGAFLRQGQSLHLHDGLAEIAFGDGARVILQGPVKFSIASASRGRLESGSLTSRVPPEAIGFAISTPRATIVDLGTEFGVESIASGETRVVVFAGSVELSADVPAANVQPVAIQRLNAGEAVVVSVAGQIRRENPKQQRFVREMPPPQSEPIRLMANWRMGEDDIEPGIDAPAAEATVDRDGQRALTRMGGPTYSGQTAAPGSALAIQFSVDQGQHYSAPRVATTRVDNWLLEAWARADSTSGTAIVVYNGDSSRSGFGIVRSGDQWQGLMGGVAVLKFGAMVRRGQWTHLALLRHNGVTRLLVDGVQVGPEFRQSPASPHGAFMVGGNPSTQGQTFDGAIDEVRLSVVSSEFNIEMLSDKGE